MMLTPRRSGMRRAFVAMTTLAVFALGACTSSPASSSTPPAPSTSLVLSPSASLSPSPTTGCSGDPHAHVYHPDRLQLLANCVTVNGVIDLVEAQPDGDFHVRLHLDQGQICGGLQCLDADNLSEQAGDLLLEPVCENPISQADAVTACVGYHNPIAIPPVGTHIAATGPFVLDQDHGWNEIHPLEAVSALPSATPPATATPVPTAAPALTVTITTSTYGSLAATTLPGASCRAQAKLPSGRISTAAGLQVAVTAGADGSVGWGYRTSSNTTPGTGTHTVTCNLNGKTASASAPFTVQ